MRERSIGPRSPARVAGSSPPGSVDRHAEVSIDGAVAAVATGTRRLGALARRPQTGQLHHYYAQTVIILALLAIASRFALMLSAVVFLALRAAAVLLALPRRTPDRTLIWNIPPPRVSRGGSG